MSNHTNKAEETQKLIEAMNMVGDIDATTKELNARLRNLMHHPVSDGKGHSVHMSEYTEELEAISKSIKALAEYRSCICRM